MTEQQHTLKQPVALMGVGLHTGEKVTIELCPAPANHGYKFQRNEEPHWSQKELEFIQQNMDSQPWSVVA
jgi:UDP-3-O-acyl-N-acetylglucosamine deacetylase